MSIPNLPKFEYAEDGYRAIRDALINIFGDGVDSDLTTSEQVVSLLTTFRYWQTHNSGIHLSLGSVAQDTNLDIDPICAGCVHIGTSQLAHPCRRCSMLCIMSGYTLVEDEEE
jgi:hypothetical protein